RLAFHAARIGLAAALAVLTVALFPSSPAIDFPIYEVGSVASDNVIAPFAFRVLKTQTELDGERSGVARAVEPVLDYRAAALDSARQALSGFAGAVAQAANTTPDLATVAVQRAALSWGMRLTASQAAYLAVPRRRDAVFQTLDRVFDRWLRAGVTSTGVLDSVHGAIVLRSGTEERRLPSDSIATFAMLVSRARLVHPDPGSAVGDSVYMRLLATFFHQTVVADPAATDARREDVRRAISPAKYEVLAGEKIVGANE